MNAANPWGTVSVLFHIPETGDSSDEHVFEGAFPSCLGRLFYLAWGTMAVVTSLVFPGGRIQNYAHVLIMRFFDKDGYDGC